MSTASAERLIREHVALPTLPQVVAKINALVDDPDVGVREIGAAVAEDAPIAAQVLRLANSARYGLREKVLSTEHASAVLGVRMLRDIAMQAAVVSQYDHLRGQSDFDLEALWRHSILDGLACSLLATRSRARIELAPEEFQVVGLLHDIGKVLLLENDAAAYLACMREARQSGVPEFRAEEARFGFHHGEVGALIATSWGLPRLVAECCRYHHGPSERLLASPTLALVALGNLMVHRLEGGDAKGARAVFTPEACALLCLRPEDVAEVVERTEALRPQITV